MRPISSLPTEIQRGSKLWLSLGQSLNLFFLEPSLGGFDGTPKIIALMKGALQRDGLLLAQNVESEQRTKKKPIV